LYESRNVNGIERKEEKRKELENHKMKVLLFKEALKYEKLKYVVII